jgi:hypothetical protein
VLYYTRISACPWFGYSTFADGTRNSHHQNERRRNSQNTNETQGEEVHCVLERRTKKILIQSRPGVKRMMMVKVETTSVCVCVYGVSVKNEKESMTNAGGGVGLYGREEKGRDDEGEPKKESEIVRRAKREAKERLH